MKKIYTLLIIVLLSIPSFSLAEKWDTEILFDSEMCQRVKYTCDTTPESENRYGWWYYTDSTGCGCMQILKDTEISTLVSKTDSLIVAIDVVFPEEESRIKLLKRIKSHLNTNYSSTTKNRLLSAIILRKLSETYWDF